MQIANLNLLDKTSELWGCPSLENVAIIGAQHIMESSLRLFQNLMKSGLDPSNVFLIGKCYSTSESVFKEFIHHGFFVCGNSFGYDSHIKFDDLYRENIGLFFKKSIEEVARKGIKKIIILDDGGYLIDLVNSLDLSCFNVVCIEQTSAGINHLENKTIQFPVLNVAKSKAKLHLETPFIVESALNRLLESTNLLTKEIQNVLILGYGAIGREVENILSNHFNVKVYDPLFSKRSHFVEMLSRADLIIGCSGRTAIQKEDYRYLKKGVCLASFSSSDREFDAQSFRKMFPQSDNCLQHFESEHVILLQSGFPINFWQSRNNMDLQKIELTLALLSSAVYQAVKLDSMESGISPVDSEAEKMLVLEHSKKFAKNLLYRKYPFLPTAACGA